MPAEEVPSVEQLNSLKLKDLKDRCRSAGLQVTGSKKDLVERLRSHLVARADEESLLLSDEALVDDAAPEADADAPIDLDIGEDVPGDLAAEGDSDSAGSQSDAADEPKLSPPHRVPTPIGGQSESTEGTKSPLPSPAAAASQSEATDGKKLSPPSCPSPSPALSQSEAAEQERKASPTPGAKTCVLRQGTTSSAGGLSDAERRELRAKRFGVVASPRSTDDATTPKEPPSKEDTTHPEIESRKRSRAERFNSSGGESGYAEPKPAQARGSRQAAEASLAPGDVERMRKRAERFGVVTSPALLAAKETASSTDKPAAGADVAEPAAKVARVEEEVVAATDSEAAGDKPDEDAAARKRASRAARFATAPEPPAEEAASTAAK